MGKHRKVFREGKIKSVSKKITGIQSYFESGNQVKMSSIRLFLLDIFI